MIAYLSALAGVTFVDEAMASRPSRTSSNRLLYRGGADARPDPRPSAPGLHRAGAGPVRQPRRAPTRSLGSASTAAPSSRRSSSRRSRASSSSTGRSGATGALAGLGALPRRVDPADAGFDAAGERPGSTPPRPSYDPAFLDYGAVFPPALRGVPRASAPSFAPRRYRQMADGRADSRRWAAAGRRAGDATTTAPRHPPRHAAPAHRQRVSTCSPCARLRRRRRPRPPLRRDDRDDSPRSVRPAGASCCAACMAGPCRSSGSTTSQWSTPATCSTPRRSCGSRREATLRCRSGARSSSTRARPASARRSVPGRSRRPRRHQLADHRRHAPSRVAKLTVLGGASARTRSRWSTTPRGAQSGT